MKPLNHSRDAKKIIRLVVLFLVLLTYGFLFESIYLRIGSGAFVAMNVFPIVAGMLFGMNIGCLFAFITVSFVIFLGSTVNLDLRSFMPTITVSGIIMISLGTGIGRLRDLSLTVRRELNKRKEIEGMLRASQGELESRVKERTIELEETTIELKKEISERIQAEEIQDELQKQLNQAQKMDSVGRLAGGVAHDFNNMLSVIQGNVEMLLEEVEPAQPEYSKLNEIKIATDRSVKLTRQLLAFARKQTVKPQVLDINQAVEGMLKMLQRLIGENIQLVWLPRYDIGSICVDPTQIDQILVNLFVNARDAITGLGKITIETGNVIVEEKEDQQHAIIESGEYIFLTVRDNGSGIDQETLLHIFEPFFTTKESGKGTGLGLSTVYGIVKQNNGLVNVISEPGRGTTFEMFFPKFEAIPTRSPEHEVIVPDASGQELILLVEDEPSILRMTKEMLQKLGYKVITAGSPEEAIRQCREYHGHIQLLITDVIMPEMNGLELAEQLLSFSPGLKRLFISGYTADVMSDLRVLEEGVHFLHKPFSKRELSMKIREVLENSN